MKVIQRGPLCINGYNEGTLWFTYKREGGPCV